MQVSLQTNEGLERTLTVQVPADRIDGQVSERLQSLRKTARINGFRPGKVPLRVVEKRFGGQVRQEVLGEVIQSTWQEAVGQEELKPAGWPRIEDIQGDAGSDLEYKAVFEVYPEVDVADLSGLAISKPAASVADEDVAEMLDKLRAQHQSFEEVERACADGDQVLINFTGYVDGEAFEGGKAEEAPLVLGSGAMIEGFEDQIVGMSKGDERQISVSFPENYHAENLSGKAATFDIELLAVREPQLPELDDAFAEKLGVTEGGCDTLRADIRKNMERELHDATEALTKQQVMDGLLDAHTVDVPKALVSEEIGRLREQFKQRLAQQMGGQPIPEGASFPDEMFSEEAGRRVKLGLVVAEIVKKAGIEPSAEDIRARVELMASAYEDPSEVIDYYYGNREMMQGIEAMVLEQSVADWVMEQAQVAEESMNFNELMERRQNMGRASEAAEDEAADQEQAPA